MNQARYGGISEGASVVLVRQRLYCATAEAVHDVRHYLPTLTPWSHMSQMSIKQRINDK